MTANKTYPLTLLTKSMLFVVLIICTTSSLKGQKLPEYDYLLEDKIKIITPTYLNLVGFMLCEDQTFINGLKHYGYNVTYNYSDELLEATIWSNGCAYSIRKKGYQIWMMFTPDKKQYVQGIIKDLNQKGLSSTEKNGIREYNIVIGVGNNYQCDMILSVVTKLEGNTSLIHARTKNK